ncbi:unnamed protein product [Calypogeia fissa]
MDSEVLEEGMKLSNERVRRSSLQPEGDGDEKEYMSMDDILETHVGEFGRAQFWHFVLVSWAWTVEAFHTMVMIFGDRVPEWQCLPPNSGVQAGGSNDSFAFMTCSASSALCDLDRGAWEWVGGKSQSTVSEWGLICGEEYKAGLAGSLFFSGVLFGAGIYGNLSDSFLGRKGSLALSCITTVSLGLLTSLAPSYWIYASLRFVTGMNAGGIGLCSFVLATEIVGPNKRGSVGMSAFYFFSGGIMLLSVVGYFSPSWRILYVATSVPGMAYCLLVVPFIWESPRWYLVKGRLNDAMRVLRSIAKWNRVTLPDSVILRLDSDEDEGGKVGQQSKKAVVGSTDNHHEEAVSLISSVPTLRPQFSDISAARLEDDAQRGEYDDIPKHQEAEGNLMDVFRYAETRWRMLIMVCIWFFTGVVYYGISLNVVNLGLNVYMSVFVNGFIEIPAFFISAVLLGKLGRKAVLVGAMALSGVCCLVGSFFFVLDTPEGLKGGNGLSFGGSSRRVGSNGTYLLEFDPTDSGLKSSGILMGILRLSCGVIGIFGMAGTYNLIYIYTTELFPTVVRNAALGLASQAGGIGSVIAPLIVVVGHFAPSLPFLFFGVFALVGAALATRLPETLNQPFHDTMEGMERTESTKLDRDRNQVSPQETRSPIIF